MRFLSRFKLVFLIWCLSLVTLTVQASEEKSCILAALSSGNPKIAIIVEELAAFKLRLDALRVEKNLALVSNLETELSNGITRLQEQLAEVGKSNLSADDIHHYIASVARSKQGQIESELEKREIKKAQQLESESDKLWISTPVAQNKHFQFFKPRANTMDNSGRMYHFSSNGDIVVTKSPQNGNPEYTLFKAEGFRELDPQSKVLFEVSPDGKTFMIAEHQGEVQIARQKGDKIEYEWVDIENITHFETFTASEKGIDSKNFYLTIRKNILYIFNVEGNKTTYEKISLRRKPYALSNTEEILLDPHENILYFGGQYSFGKIDLNKEVKTAQQIGIGKPKSKSRLRNAIRSPNGELIFRFLVGEKSYLLSLHNGEKLLREFHFEGMESFLRDMTFSSNGEYLLLGGMYHHLLYADLNKSRDLIYSEGMPLPGNLDQTTIRRVFIQPDGKTLFVVGDKADEQAYINLPLLLENLPSRKEDP